MYFMKLEVGEFTFRPPDHARVTPDGFAWQTDVEDRDRLEADLAEMPLWDNGDTPEDLRKQVAELEDELADARREAHRALQILRRLNWQIEEAKLPESEELFDDLCGEWLGLVGDAINEVS